MCIDRAHLPLERSLLSRLAPCTYPCLPPCRMYVHVDDHDAYSLTDPHSFTYPTLWQDERVTNGHCLDCHTLWTSSLRTPQRRDWTVRPDRYSSLQSTLTTDTLCDSDDAHRKPCGRVERNARGGRRPRGRIRRRSGSPRAPHERGLLCLFEHAGLQQCE